MKSSIEMAGIGKQQVREESPVLLVFWVWAGSRIVKTAGYGRWCEGGQSPSPELTPSLCQERWFCLCLWRPQRRVRLTVNTESGLACQHVIVLPSFPEGFSGSLVVSSFKENARVRLKPVVLHLLLQCTLTILDKINHLHAEILKKSYYNQSDECLLDYHQFKIFTLFLKVQFVFITSLAFSQHLVLQ